MADEETIVESGEGTGEDLSEATAAELAAQEAAGRVEQAAPQTEPEIEEFEYKTPDGKVVVLTKEQADAVQGMMDADERADKLAAELEALKAKPAEKPAEAAKPAEGDKTEGAVAAVNWDVVGDELTTMMEGGRTKDIGPALQGIINREVVKSPFIAASVAAFVHQIMDEREAASKTGSTLKEALGDEADEATITALKKLDPSSRQAVLGLINSLQGKATKTEAASTEKAAAAKKVGEKEAIIRAKARGTLRPVTGKNVRPGAAGDLKKGVNLADPDERAAAAAKFIERRRASGVVD